MGRVSDSIVNTCIYTGSKWCAADVVKKLKSRSFVKSMHMQHSRVFGQPPSMRDFA